MNVNNNTQQIGNIGNDAERTNFNNGKGVLDFSIAQTTKFTNDLGEEKENTIWHQCKLFRKQETLDKIEKYFKKGRTVILSGELNYEDYTNKQDQRVIRAYIKVADFRFMPKGEKASNGSNEGETVQEPA